MRYIPGLTSDIIVQVPEDKNAYINVRNIGASGQGDLKFTGIVTDIDDRGIVTISTFGDQITEYNELLRQGVQIQVFGYRDPGTVESSSIGVTSHSFAGVVDYSSQEGTNSDLGSLKYFVFGFDADRGTIVNYRSAYEVGQKILNPDFWDTERHVKLDFSRTSTSVLPVIYRSWNGIAKFLGIIGNNKVGYPGSTPGFIDLGDSEIPSWESDPVLPSFLSPDLFLNAGSEVSLTKKLTAKETLRILPKPFGAQLKYIQCTGLRNGSKLAKDDSVIFYIDDTEFIRQAINTAARGGIKEVFIPSGVYNIRDTSFVTNSVTDYSNLSLRGVGEGTIIRRLPSTISNSTDPGLLNFTNASGIRIRSIAVDGNRLESFSTNPPAESETTIVIKNSSNVVISDCSVYDNAGAGISIYNTNGISLMGNKITRTGRSYETPASPLLIDTSENVVAQGNLIEFATTGPKVISTDYSTINGNIIRGCGDQGIFLETSSQWNAQGNLAYNDNDSIIRSIDTYNNEYSRATIEVRKGFSLDPIYMTVTYGGESVGIPKSSVKADIYQLDANGNKIGSPVGNFKVLETANQLEAGIFSLTLPGGTINQGTVIATGNLNNPYGYIYEVSGSVLIGGFRPLSIRPFENNFLAIRLRNSSDILGFQIYSQANVSENDSIVISGFNNENLSNWDQNASRKIQRIDTDTNSIIIESITTLNLTGEVEFSGGTLSILRPNYFIADGNLFIHSF